MPPWVLAAFTIWPAISLSRNSNPPHCPSSAFRSTPRARRSSLSSQEESSSCRVRFTVCALTLTSSFSNSVS